MEIKIKYEQIPNYPKIYREIRENNKPFKSEQEIQPNYIEEIEQSELQRDNTYKLKIYTKQKGLKSIISEETVQYSPATKEFPRVTVNIEPNENNKEFNFNVTYEPLDVKIFLSAKEGNDILLCEDDEYSVENGVNTFFLSNKIKYNTNYEFSFWTKYNDEYKQVSIIHNGQKIEDSIVFNIVPHNFETLNIKEIYRGAKKIADFDDKENTYHLKNVSYNEQLGLYEGYLVFKYRSNFNKKEKVISEKLLFYINEYKHNKYRIIIDKNNNKILLVYFSCLNKYGKMTWRFTTSSDDKVQESRNKEQIIKERFISELICSC